MRIPSRDVPEAPFAVVLGIAQDGGVPQAGTRVHPGWEDTAFRRHAACLALVDPTRDARWIVDATPDFREQLHMLDTLARPGSREAEAPDHGTDTLAADRNHGIEGIVLTHAHVGHYTGLLHIGREAMCTHRLPLHVMPRMAAFLETHAPWEALVREGNVALCRLGADVATSLGPFEAKPVVVPHRGPYSETIGLRIDGPSLAVLYLPDVDGWEACDDAGLRIEALIESVDVAYLGGTFFDAGELSRPDRSVIGHPTITASMARFGALAPRERRKIRFIHLNHTNPALWPESDARRRVEHAGFAVAEELEVLAL